MTAPESCVGEQVDDGVNSGHIDDSRRGSLALVIGGANEEFILDNVNLKVPLGNTGYICEYGT